MAETTVLGTAIQVAASVLLSQVPSWALKSKGLRASTVLSFLAILAMSHVGGLLFALPLTAALALVLLWISFVGRAEGRAKRILFRVTLTLICLSLVVHVINLPIRFLLHQPELRIWGNIVGILACGAFLAGSIEVLRKQRKERELAAGTSASSVPDATAPQDPSDE